MLFILYLPNTCSVLRKTENLFACTDSFDDGEKLLLHYAGPGKLTCKTLSTDGKKTASVKPVDWKFQQKLTGNWQQIETIYNSDQMLVSLKASVKDIREKLSTSLLFVNGDSFSCFDTLESYQKQKKNGTDAPAILQGSLFVLCVSISAENRLYSY